MGFGNPQVPWIELEHQLSDRGSDGRPPGSPPWTNAGGDSPAWSRKRQPYEPPPALERRADAVPYAELHCHSNFSFLDGASPPRGAGRGGGPPRPRGAGPHRPRRLLRRGPLRRGGPRGRPAHRVRRRAHRSARPTPAERRAPTRRRAPGRARPRTRRATPGWAAPISRAQMAGEKGAPRSLAPATSWPSDGRPAGDWSVLTGCRKGAVPAALVERRPGRRRPRAATGWSTRSGATTWRSSCGTTATRSTRPATTRWPSWPSAPASTCVATNNVHYATPARRPLATALAAVRARRSLDEIDGWLPGGRRRPPAVRGRAGPPVRPLPRRGRAGRRARAEPARSTSRSSRPNLPPFPCPAGHDEMSYLRALTARARQRRYGPRGVERVPGAYAQIDHELDVIEQLGFPGYFLIVWDIVEFCRRSRHLLPGAGLGRQLRGLLRARHHQRRRGVARPAVRAVPVARARRPARHRPRHRERPARGGHPVRLRALRPRATPPRSPTSSPTGPSRRCATWPRRSATRPASRTRGRSRSTAWGRRRADGRADDHDIPAAVLELAARGRALPAPPRHPLGRHGDLRPAGGRGVPGRVGAHGEPQRAAVGQGRLRGGRPGEVRPARPRDALGAALRGRPRPRRTTAYEVDLATIPQDDAVYDMLCRADSVGRVPGREPGPDGHAAPAASPARSTTSWSRWRSSAPARSRAGRCTPTSAAATARSRSPTCTRCSSRRWPRRSACRCSRSSSCRWPSTSPASRPARPTSCARPWARSAAASAWSGCAARLYEGMAERGITGEIADEIYEKLAAFANFGFPESHSVSFAYLVYASSWIKLLLPGGVLRGAAQRPADGLLLAALAGAGRPPPRRRGAHARRQRVGDAQATLEPCDRSRTGRRGRCGSASGRCAASATTWPSASPPAARTPTWRTSCGAPARHARRSSRRWPPRARSAASSLDRREALWAAGAVAQSRPDRLAGVVTGARRAARCRA